MAAMSRLRGYAVSHAPFNKDTRVPLARAPMRQIRVRGVPYTSTTKSQLADAVTAVATRVVANWPQPSPGAAVMPVATARAPDSVALLEAAAGAPSEASLAAARRFVAEVLRRSRSSYAILQTALFYLVRLRRVLTSGGVCPSPSLYCGRRMFMAALMVASKYLQDRSFCTSAWSRISGLPCVDINANEVAMLTALDWRLHVPDQMYDSWCQTMLKLAGSESSGASDLPYPAPNTPPSLGEPSAESDAEDVCLENERPTLEPTLLTPANSPGP